MERGLTRRDFLGAGAAAGLAYALGARNASATESHGADLILSNGRFATMSRERPFAEAVSIRDGRFSSVGSVADVMREKGPATRVIDVGGGTVIPGLNDSHTHPIRGGLNYNLELRWDGVPSLSDALALLREQARRTPPPHWVRVVGGWSAFQFKERRLPTLEEINAAAPDTPVFILHLYDRAWLNGAALRAVGYTKDTPEPPGGEIQRDKSGQPHRAAGRPAERLDPVLDARQGPEALVRRAAQLEPPLHARAEPARRDERDRRRRRLPELPRRLQGHPGAGRGRASSPRASPTTCSRSGPRASWRTSSAGPGW